MNLKRLQLLVCVFAAVALSAASSEEEADSPSRKGRVFSPFNIVRFQNEPCGQDDESVKAGTCYTAEECSAKSGNSVGTCAGGYGVCCSFSVNCGAKSAENCTYFESTGGEAGGCAVDICRCSDNICQLRLDFNMFMITGPSTSSLSVGFALAGETTEIVAGVAVSHASKCLTDTFTVSNPGSKTPSTLCGVNSGQHMYVDVCGESCNKLQFQLGNTGIGTSVANQRRWEIKVTQYACDYENLAPDGCTQYYFGPDATDTVQSFNYAGGQHLANQDQNICVRRERGNCRICWTTEEKEDFQVSGMTTTVGFAVSTMCCNYGTAGVNTMGYDCLNIPGALLVDTSSKMGPSKFCGQIGLVKSGILSTMSNTICSDRQPFSIRFLSDAFELATEAIVADKGFKLTYTQNSDSC